MPLVVSEWQSLPQINLDYPVHSSDPAKSEEGNEHS
jgi:hypothetical protein